MSNNFMSNFLYTKDSVYLTNAQRQFYEDNGYLLVKNLVDWNLLDECKERFLKFCNEKDSDVRVLTTMRDPYLKKQDIKVVQIQELLFDEVFFKYAAYKPLVDIVQSMIGSNITVFHSMLINKPPESTIDNSRHPMHQDLLYMPLRPASSIVTTWTAMERVTKENGCLFVVPGSHKRQLYTHDLPPNVKNYGFHGAIGVGDVTTVSIEMEKGDTIFFHPLLLHGSWPNLTKGFRKALSCSYGDSNIKFINVKGTIQENMGNEIERLGRRMGFKDASVNVR
ncbi:hypothetical protein FQA39_LY00084 [Lamprigera yunnana]|nr:hypothetical protein FQA39_LY00084 [Lamprigera yunnana]